MIILLFTLISYNSFAKGNITINYENKEVKKNKIDRIEIKNDGVEIIAKKGPGCFIPFKKVVETPRVQIPNCETCQRTDEQVKQEFIEMFQNAKAPDVSCDVKDKNVAGYDFTGRTVINGQSVLIRRGVVFDMAYYDKNVKSHADDEDDSALGEALNSIGKTLFNFLIY